MPTGGCTDPYDANRLLYVARGSDDVAFTVERVRQIHNTDKPRATPYGKGHALAALSAWDAKHVVNITQLSMSLTYAETGITVEKFRTASVARGLPKMMTTTIAKMILRH